MGLYKRGNCVCHREAAARSHAEGGAPDDFDDELGRAVDELLEAAGVNVREQAWDGEHEESEEEARRNSDC